MPAKRAAVGRSEAKSRSAGLGVRLQSFGPTPDQIRALEERLPTHPRVRKYLTKTRSRLLQLQFVDPPEETKTRRPVAPSEYRATFYDYTNNRAILVTGNLRRPQALTVEESSSQPLPRLI